MKEHSCSNCYFFYKTSQKDDQTIGYCRANPPTPYFEPDDNGIIVPRISRFPIVLNNMWCGAWDFLDSAIEENNSRSEERAA